MEEKTESAEKKPEQVAERPSEPKQEAEKNPQQEKPAEPKQEAEKTEVKPQQEEAATAATQ